MDFCCLPPYHRLASCMAGGTAVMPWRGQGPARGRAGLVSRHGPGCQLMIGHGPGRQCFPRGAPRTLRGRVATGPRGGAQAATQAVQMRTQSLHAQCMQCLLIRTAQPIRGTMRPRVLLWAATLSACAACRPMQLAMLSCPAAASTLSDYAATLSACAVLSCCLAAAMLSACAAP